MCFSTNTVELTFLNPQRGGSFLTYLRRELNSSQRKIIKNCKLADSKGNVLIQMADMIAGSVRRSYDVKAKDSGIYKDIIKKHIADEWLFK